MNPNPAFPVRVIIVFAVSLWRGDSTFFPSWLLLILAHPVCTVEAGKQNAEPTPEFPLCLTRTCVCTRACLSMRYSQFHPSVAQIILYRPLRKS